MAKRNKKKDQSLPEGMSRRQAKLAARAAERAALETDPRPFGGLAMECELVALQEFVPSATAQLKIKGKKDTITLCTVLPGAVAGFARSEAEGGEIFVALQTKEHSHNPGRDLAHQLAWAKKAKPGDQLASAVSDGTQPALTDLIDPKQELTTQAHQDYNWWLGENPDEAVVNSEQMNFANNALLSSDKVAADVSGECWWIDNKTKAYIRWVRPEDEDKVFKALARIAARGELNLGENTRFAGVFRTHGITVPVFELDREDDKDSFIKPLEELDKKIVAEFDNDTQLTGDERRQLQNINSRQVTIR